MAKKPLTQVKEWLEAMAEGKADNEPIDPPTAGEVRKRAKQLDRIDARDSQVERKYLAKRKKAK